MRGEPDVDPTQITVRGPVSVVEVMQFARLSAFDVSGLSGQTQRRTRPRRRRAAAAERHSEVVVS